MIYLRRVVNGRSNVAFVQAKSKVILVGQANWVISRKELEAASLCTELSDDCVYFVTAREL